MPLTNDLNVTSMSTPTPSSSTEGTVSESSQKALLQFQSLLREFFGAQGHDHLSMYPMTPNPRIHESRRGPVSNNSPYRGVTQHKKSRKWESHIWKHGKQLYCGAFSDAADAAKAHDVIGLRLKRTKASTNFLPKSYEKLLPLLEHVTESDVIRCLRDCAQRHYHEGIQRKRTRTNTDPTIPLVPEPEMPRVKQEVEQLDSVTAPSFEGTRHFTRRSVCPKKHPIPRYSIRSTMPVQDWLAIPSSEMLSMNTGITAPPIPPSLGWYWEYLTDMHTPTDGLNGDAYILSSVPEVQIPILQGRVIEAHNVYPFHPSYFEAESTSRTSSAPPPLFAENHLSMEHGEASNGSSSDLEIQAVVHSVSLHDEFEMQQQLEEGIVGINDEYRDHSLL